MRKIQIALSSDLCIRLTWNLTGSCGQQQRLCGWSRMVVKQFQDGGWPPFWKSIYRHISVKNYPIFMKFCTQQQILNWMNVTWSKMKKLHWTDSEFDRTYFLLLKNQLWWLVLGLQHLGLLRAYLKLYGCANDGYSMCGVQVCNYTVSQKRPVSFSSVMSSKMKGFQ